MSDQALSAREDDIVSTMTRLADSLVSDFDPFEILRDLSESCTRVLGADEAGVSVRNGERLDFVVATSERMELIELFQADHAEGPCFDAFRSGEHVAASDLSVDEGRGRWPVWTPRAVELGFCAADAYPLRLRNETIGALNVYSHHSRRLDDRDVTVGGALADVATIGLIQHRMIADRELVRDQLQYALNSRVVIEQAKGMSAERHNIALDEAFERIRRHARATNTRIAEVARQVVDGSLDTSTLV